MITSTINNIVTTIIITFFFFILLPVIIISRKIAILIIAINYGVDQGKLYHQAQSKERNLKFLPFSHSLIYLLFTYSA